MRIKQSAKIIMEMRDELQGWIDWSEGDEDGYDPCHAPEKDCGECLYCTTRTLLAKTPTKHKGAGQRKGRKQRC